jgi:hypothetical protein
MIVKDNGFHVVAEVKRQMNDDADVKIEVAQR